jgi:uncharacterized protein (DUF302 family)
MGMKIMNKGMDRIIKLNRKSWKYNIKKINTNFDQAVHLVTESLKKEGFGILTEINLEKQKKN